MIKLISTIFVILILNICIIMIEYAVDMESYFISKFFGVDSTKAFVFASTIMIIPMILFLCIRDLRRFLLCLIEIFLLGILAMMMDGEKSMGYICNVDLLSSTNMFIEIIVIMIVLVSELKFEGEYQKHKEKNDAVEDKNKP